jgi:hypothetical protein
LDVFVGVSGPVNSSVRPLRESRGLKLELMIKRRILISYGIGLLIFVLLYLFVYFAAAHQDNNYLFGIFTLLGYLISFFLAFPIFLYCGADCNPPIAVLVLTGIIDATVISLIVLTVWSIRNPPK